MADETPKTDWKVGDTCYIDGVRHKITDLITIRLNGLPDCVVERSAWFEDMKETP